MAPGWPNSDASDAGTAWRPRKGKPKECPNCKSRFWGRGQGEGMTGDDPATNRQKQWISDLGATAIPEDLSRAEASAWIDGSRSTTRSRAGARSPRRGSARTSSSGRPRRGPRRCRR